MENAGSSPLLKNAEIFIIAADYCWGSVAAVEGEIPQIFLQQQQFTVVSSDSPKFADLVVLLGIFTISGVFEEK